jgi:hypothetical protein
MSGNSKREQLLESLLKCMGSSRGAFARRRSMGWISWERGKWRDSCLESSFRSGLLIPADGCPPLSWHILEVIINALMVIEVGTRWVAYGKVRGIGSRRRKHR